jgi:hypothetical protein
VLGSDGEVGKRACGKLAEGTAYGHGVSADTGEDVCVSVPVPVPVSASV